MERRSIVEVLMPIRKEAYPPAGYTATRVIRDMAKIVDRNELTIVFTNTRSGAERISHRLKLALPKIAEQIECHHSSLDRDIRLDVEDRLKLGALRAQRDQQPRRFFGCLHCEQDADNDQEGRSWAAGHTQQKDVSLALPQSTRYSASDNMPSAPNSPMGEKDAARVIGGSVPAS